ncbi:AraC family transcriptional regulator [Agaribacterium haliotis]|uniref:AraC family transcriptional regulator n=1 Tax=Agaribacterium haliotis TaxID=2013869 RepID=UPI000BB58770|nr:AraC family transcriptional regulator [Agaribacterium haliotis]
MQPSTLSSWALLIWQELKERGHNPKAVFDQLSMDAGMLSQNMARYKMESMIALWGKAYELTGDDMFGIKVGERWNPTTFHALGFAWLASTSLLEAFQRLARYCRLLNDALDIRVYSEASNYRFRLGLLDAAQGIKAHPLAYEASQMTCLKMCRMLLGDDFTPLEVNFKYPRTPATQELENRFGCNIVCDAEQSDWLISHFDMHRSIATGNDELAQMNDNVALKYLSQLDKSQILPALQHALIEALPSGEVSENDIAAKLHMSPRTLQRKLEAEQQTFSSVLNELRKKLSRHYIETSSLSLTEITYLLGFSEQASFTRAFKRWYEQTPSQYQKSLPQSA